MVMGKVMIKDKYMGINKLIINYLNRGFKEDIRFLSPLEVNQTLHLDELII